MRSGCQMGIFVFFRDDEKKSGVGELCCTACCNPSATVICGVVGCVIVDYEFD